MPQAIIIILLIVVISSDMACAGMLLIQNNSARIINCQLDNGSISNIAIKPFAAHKLGFSPVNNSIPVKISLRRCDGIKLRGLNISPSSTDRFLILNGKAKHALNVLLYSRIPSYPHNNFAGMTTRLITEFQALHPAVLLNVVISEEPELTTYDFNNLPRLLSKDGYDVVELDAMELEFMVKHSLVSPVKIKEPTKFLPAALTAAKINHLFYGVPSRVCEYFLFNRFQTDQNNFTLFTSLLLYLKNLSKDRAYLVSDFNGHWNLLSFYLQIYASVYGVENLNAALQQPLKKLVIKYLADLGDQCAFRKDNKCINFHYHTQEPGLIEKTFAINNAHSYLGFSESAFYILLHSTLALPKASLHAAPIAYGRQYKPLLYTDLFVKNAATCKTAHCNINFNLFTNYMHMLKTQMWINFSKDLPAGAPPRYLLPAIKSFYQISQVVKDPLYAEFTQNLRFASSFPNNLSIEQYKNFYHQVCGKLAINMPGYKCY